MKVAVCDDFADCRKVIIDYLHEYAKENDLNFEIFEFECAEDLLDSTEPFTFVFLDVEMGKMNGIDAVEVLNERLPSAIIFIITAYNSYLDDAMDLNVFRYISKPVSKERIFFGLDKAFVLMNMGKVSFKITNSYRISIPKDRICYVEIDRRHVHVVTDNDEFYTKKKMSYFKESLTASNFIVPHNSYIVNLDFVKDFNSDEIIMIDDYVIPIALTKKAVINQRIFRHFKEQYYE